MSIKTLRSLFRIRELALDETRRALRSCLDAETEAQRMVSEAEKALQDERQAASSLEVGDGAVEAYAAWLPHGRASRDDAEQRLSATELATLHARAQLSAARASFESTKAAVARQTEADLLVAARREQAVLDEMGQLRRSK